MSVPGARERAAGAVPAIHKSRTRHAGILTLANIWGRPGPRVLTAESPQATVRLMLEVIDKGSCTEAHPVPLLFVHGGWHGAWCWDDHFLDFFAAAGYRAVAVSLRGHGSSPTAKPLPKVSMADYIDDVHSVADDLGGSPVLIGHSLGGFTIQRYLEDRTAPAAVLVGSLPPQGVLGAALRVWRRRPSMTLEARNDPTLLKFLATPALTREYLFSPDTPEAIPERSLGITVMPTLVVSPFSRPAPIPVISMPPIIGT